MKQYLIRLISSKDHDISKNKLTEIIRKTGTDKYDPTRKHIFHNFYGKHNVDFFAEHGINESNLEGKITEALEKFPDRTKGDRGRSVVPDIVIVYDAEKCEMIERVYDYKSGSDCFRFITNPIDALIEVRSL